MATIDETTKEKLQSLSSELASARSDESEAKKRRILVEEAIVCLLDPGERSSVTVDPGNGLKLTVKTDVSYKADTAGIASIDSDFVIYKPDLDVKAYEGLRLRKGRFAEMPDMEAKALFDKLSQHVTVTPKKPAVSLKIA